MTHQNGAPELVFIGVIIAAVLLVVSLLHLGIAIALAVRLRRGSPTQADNSKLPKVGVVISLRGADANLRNCLRGLFDQDYPAYDVEIVVDSDRDPAWKLAQGVIRETGCDHANRHALIFRRRTCSLKCSALIQGVGALDASHEVIAFCDSDVVPHRTWLRELVSPLLDHQIGATTGNRWYAGDRRLIGSQVRAAWNAGAVAQMSAFRIAWGGTLAIRRKTLNETGLLARWSQSLNDDLVLGEAVRRLGLEIRLVPSLLMVEREESSLPSVCAFVFRQLMHTRFYLQSWPVVAGFGMLRTLLALAAVVLFFIGIAQGNGEAVCWSGGGTVAFVTVLAISYFVVERAVAAALRKSDRAFEPLGIRALWAAPMAMCLFAAALLPALVRRTVNWRGVAYRISDPWQVELLKDRQVAELPASRPVLTQP